MDLLHANETMNEEYERLKKLLSPDILECPHCKTKCVGTLAFARHMAECTPPPPPPPPAPPKVDKNLGRLLKGMLEK